MIITFESLYLQNFLSVGDNGVTIHLNRAFSTLVTGTNGAGKSAIVCDALIFCMFGKSYRGLTKNEQLNSINKKALRVELTLHKSDGTQYTIVRGIKPNKFEIYQDGEKQYDEYSVAQQQTVLENDILGFGYNAFTQTCLLSTTDYTPFMKLSAGKRRELIEELLDIGVFGDMKERLGAKIKSVKSDIESAKRDCTHIENSIETMRSYYQKLKKQIETGVQNIQDNLDSEQANYDQKQEQLRKLVSQFDENELTTTEQQIKDVDDRLKQYQAEYQQLSSDLNKHEKERSFYQSNDTCMSCKQHIDDQFKTDRINELDQNIQDIEQKQADLNKVVDEQKHQLDDLKQTRDRLRDQKQTIQQYQNECTSIQNKIDAERKKLNDQQSASQNDIDCEANNIRDEAGKLEEKKKEQTKYENKRDIYLTAYKLLADDGIKASIINTYLPILNASINHYLDLLNFNIAFELDSEFNESIRSRYRDEFTYKSFSMGQRQRIDLALIFAWRKVAQQKNSVYTNLLIFDELFDSSIDSEGADDLKAMMDYELDEHTNVFCISHRPELAEMFEETIAFDLEDGFTTMTETQQTAA